ncbi:hypothetical protein V8G54_012584 [Vigna mungo]|uniref:Uncharacterized protein n=1 Tax=Vigna mungo TaxID=3915 RepID=A0AAQ3S3H8_VIGMU
MAQETLGDWGGAIATVAYVFLGYSSMVAYSCKSGEILFQLINLPAPISGTLFTALFTMLVSIWGTKATDRVNQFIVEKQWCFNYGCCLLTFGSRYITYWHPPSLLRVLQGAT